MVYIQFVPVFSRNDHKDNRKSFVVKCVGGELLLHLIFLKNSFGTSIRSICSNIDTMKVNFICLCLSLKS